MEAREYDVLRKQAIHRQEVVEGLLKTMDDHGVNTIDQISAEAGKAAIEMMRKLVGQQIADEVRAAGYYFLPRWPKDWPEADRLWNEIIS